MVLMKVFYKPEMSGNIQDSAILQAMLIAFAIVHGWIHCDTIWILDDFYLLNRFISFVGPLYDDKFFADNCNNYY